MSSLIINLGPFKTIVTVLVVYQTHMYLQLGKFLLNTTNRLFLMLNSMVYLVLNGEQCLIANHVQFNHQFRPFQNHSNDLSRLTNSNMYLQLGKFLLNTTNTFCLSKAC